MNKKALFSIIIGLTLAGPALTINAAEETPQAFVAAAAQISEGPEDASRIVTEAFNAVKQAEKSLKKVEFTFSQKGHVVGLESAEALQYARLAIYTVRDCMKELGTIDAASFVLCSPNAARQKVLEAARAKILAAQIESALSKVKFN